MAFRGLCEFTWLAWSKSLCVSAALRDDPCALASLWFDLAQTWAFFFFFFHFKSADISDVCRRGRTGWTQIRPVTTRACNFAQMRIRQLRIASSQMAVITGMREYHVECARRLKIKIVSESTQHRGAQLPRLARSLTSHHFYSLNEHACQIPLKVQVTKTIRMSRFFGALLKQRPFHYQRERELRHFCLPQQAKLGQISCIPLHMSSVSIIRNQTVTGNHSSLHTPSNRWITRPQLSIYLTIIICRVQLL